MNWDAISFDWNQVRAFLATADEGTFSAAAKVLRTTQPTIGRQVAGLEEDLAITLFERIGKTLVLTEAGIELLEHVREMGEAATRISLAASGRSQAIVGLVRVSVSDIFAAALMPPILKEMEAHAPELQFDIVATNDLSDLQRREADIAVRHVQPVQPDLIARRICDAEARFYASSDYLDRAGRPGSLEELSKLEFVSIGERESAINYMNRLGLELRPKNFRISSENGNVAWDFVRQGFGVMIMASSVGDRTEGIELVLPDMQPVTFPVWLIAHRELLSSRRVRLVFDHLAEKLLSLS